MGRERAGPCSDVKSMQLRQVNVEQNQIRLQFFGLLNAFQPIRRLDGVELRPAAKRKALYANLLSQVVLKCLDTVFRGVRGGAAGCVTVNGAVVTTLEIRVPNFFDESLAVLFSGKEVIAVAGNRGSGPGNWVVSPAGSFAASENGIIVRRDGGSVDPPQNLPGGRAVAFSPDDQWLAYVTSASIYLIGTPQNSEPGRIIRLPLGAQDLVWEPAGVTTGTSTVVR